MSEDTIRNIQFNNSDSVYSVHKLSDRPLNKKNQQKEYNPERKKDHVDISEELLTENKTEENTIVPKNKIEIDNQTGIDILVE